MFSRALMVIRQYYRLSQIEAAERIGISRSYLNEIEKGKKEPSLDILKKYSEAFDIPLSHIMLFAENEDGDNFDKVRMFAADKVLRILEWLAEGGSGDERKQSGASSDKSVPPLSV